MSPKMPNPTETTLGTLNKRDGLPRQRAHGDRLVRRLRASARVVLVFLLLVLAPFVLAGPMACVDALGALRRRCWSPAI
jgi:hypothetical protein